MNVKYVLFVWIEDLEENDLVISLAKIIEEDNGIVCSFPKNDEGFRNKFYAREDYRKLYPNIKIIDVM